MTAYRLAAFLLTGFLAGWFAAGVLLPCCADAWRRGRGVVTRWAERQVGGIGYGEIMDGPQESNE